MPYLGNFLPPAPRSSRPRLRRPAAASVQTRLPLTDLEVPQQQRRRCAFLEDFSLHCELSSSSARFDVFDCPCGGRRRVIAPITSPDVARKILGLPSRPPPRPQSTGPALPRASLTAAAALPRRNLTDSSVASLPLPPRATSGHAVERLSPFESSARTLCALPSSRPSSKTRFVVLIGVGFKKRQRCSDECSSATPAARSSPARSYRSASCRASPTPAAPAALRPGRSSSARAG